MNGNFAFIRQLSSKVRNLKFSLLARSSLLSVFETQAFPFICTSPICVYVV